VTDELHAPVALSLEESHWTRVVGKKNETREQTAISPWIFEASLRR
jgi:hypothetical protein